MFKNRKEFNFYVYLNPDKIFKRVLFPAPDGPKIADNWPALKLPLTPCKIVLLSGERKKKLIRRVE